MAVKTKRAPHVLPADAGIFDSDPRATRSLLEGLRAEGCEVVTDNSGLVTWFLTADDSDEVLAAPELRAGMAMAVLELSGVTDGPLYDLWSDMMFGKDGDDHKRIRQSVARRLTPRAVAELRPSVECIARELLASWPSGTVVDAWPTFAVPLPARTACALIGIPDEDAGRIAGWALQLVQAFGILDPSVILPTQTAAAELVAYLDDLIERSVAAEGTVLWALTASDGHGLTARQIRAVVANLVFGGLDATAKAITTGLAHLLGNPTAWSALAADPSRMAPSAVAEILRFFPPVAGVARLASESICCRDIDIDANKIVMVSLDAVCRDRHQHERPDHFEIDRPQGKQYAFGAGAHYCLGANVAKLVLDVAFRDLADSFPGLRLAEEPARLPWAQNPVRGIVALPVHVPSR